MQVITYSIVLLVLIGTFALWIIKYQSKCSLSLFWIAGFLLVSLVPQPEIQTDDPVRFAFKNFTIFALLVMYSENFTQKVSQKAVFLTLTTVWQSRLVIVWFQHELKDLLWIWNVIFHLILVGIVAIAQNKLKLAGLPKENSEERQVQVTLEAAPVQDNLKLLSLFNQLQTGVVVTLFESRQNDEQQSIGEIVFANNGLFTSELIPQQSEQPLIDSDLSPKYKMIEREFDKIEFGKLEATSIEQISLNDLRFESNESEPSQPQFLNGLEFIKSRSITSGFFKKQVKKSKNDDMLHEKR